MGKLVFAILLVPNAWFSNPRHPDSDPRIIRKNNLETSMTKYTFCDPRYRKSFQNGVSKSTKSRYNIKPGTQSVLSGAPHCPRIVPRSPSAPRWMHQACKMTSLDTKNLGSVAKMQRIHNISKQWAMARGRRQRA